MSRQNRNSRNGKKSGPAADSAGRSHQRKGKSRDSRSKRANPAQNSRIKGLIWGQHAALAALNNPKRHIQHGWVTEKARQRLKLDADSRLDTVDPREIDAIVPDGASHQGIALQSSALNGQALEELATPASGLILVLDQITDPHNVGTIFRLAAAFGAKGIIMQDRHAPRLDGATAKVAVGYVETVTFALVTNIADSLEALKTAGWIVTGLAGETDMALEQALKPPKNANTPANVLVLGAEGPGLRPRVRKSCDYLAKIPMPGGAESLNVATAAAIAAYEASKLTSG